MPPTAQAGSKMPAARVTDKTSHPGVIAGPGVLSVLINKLPAATVGTMHTCSMPPQAGPHSPTPIAEGSGSVFIGGQAAARMKDKVGCGAMIVGGSADVFIGD